MGNIDLAGNTFGLIVFATVLGLIPLGMLLLTAFVKISVVFFILRNAIGLQQTPANLVLSGFAAVLAMFISAPVMTDVYSELRSPAQRFQSVQDWERAFTNGSQPVKKFLVKHTTVVERTFFATAAQKVWGRPDAPALEEDSLFVLIPSFMMHEITAAFKIGFMLYLPFLAIDLIVANVLMALGMMMMSPTIVAVPFKLLLFVAADGWNQLVRGLILSYAV